MSDTIRICPFCKDEGRKSALHPSGYGTTTCMGVTPGHYDEAGSWVPGYDPNIRSTSYSCSNGHVFGVSSRQGRPDEIGLIPPRARSEGEAP